MGTHIGATDLQNDGVKVNGKVRHSVRPVVVPVKSRRHEDH